eukprot:jgi/Picre1/32228/NNA_007574.t1
MDQNVTTCFATKDAAKDRLRASVESENESPESHQEEPQKYRVKTKASARNASLCTLVYLTTCQNDGNGCNSKTILDGRMAKEEVSVCLTGGEEFCGSSSWARP